MSASLTAAPDGALPFAAFLDDLRRRGLAIGVRESTLFYRLLARFEGDLTTELRDAIAALLARNQAEVALIRRVFDDLMIAEPPEPAPAPRPPRSRWPWIAALLAAAALATAVWASVQHMRPPDDSRVKTDTDVPPPPPPPPPDPYQPAPPPAPERATVEVPRLSWELVRSPWPYLVWLGSAGAVLLALAAVRRSRGMGAAMQSELRSRMAAVPGPQHFPIAIPPYRGLGADALDDFATWIGRIARDRVVTRHLDLDGSVRSTVRHGRPVLVFGDRPPPSALLVLEDVGPEMRPWRRKVAAFVTGLEQRGVRIERWTFDTHAATVSSRAHGAPVPLAALTGAADGSLLVVVSTGMGVLGEQRALNRWVRELAAFPARVWLNPIPDETRWRGGLARAPMPVLPLTGPSLAHAARLLGADVPEAALRAPASAPATGDPVTQIRQLAALLAIADPDLLMWLRESFLPDVPEHAVLDVLDGHGAWGGRRLTWQPGERAAALARLRRDHPGRELQVRRRLIELLDHNEPPAGTAAHLRWRLARAEQAAFLATPTDASAARRELAALAASPLGEETDHVLTFLAASPAGPGADRGLLRSAAWHRSMRAIGTGARRERVRAVRPARHGLRRTDLLRAVVAGALVVGAVSLPRERILQLPNVEAYHIDVASPDAYHPQPDRAETLARQAGGPALVAVALRPDRPERGQVLVDGAALPGEQPFFAGPILVEPGHWYQLRGRLPSGAWAVSNQRLVPRPPPPKLETGTLVVHLSDGEGHSLDRQPITIDGDPQSSDTPIILTVGEHKLSVNLPEFDPWTARVMVTRDEHAYNMELRRRSAPRAYRGPCTRTQDGKLTTGPSSSCPKINRSDPAFDRIAKYEKDLHYDCTEVFDCQKRAAVLALSIPSGVAPRDVLINGKPWDGAPLAADPGDEIAIELRDPYYDFKRTFTITGGQRRLEVKAAPTYGLLVIERPAKSSADYKIRPEMQEVVRLRDAPGSSGGPTRTYRGRAGSYEVIHSDGSKTAVVEVEVGKTAQIGVGPVTAPEPDDSTTHATVSPAEAAAWVNAHNRVRAQHCASPLRWSGKLADVAQRWADLLRNRGCKLGDSGGTFGENLGAATAGMSDPESIVQTWYRELAQYRFADGSFSTSTGRFTQVVWRATTQVGCGRSECNALDIFVCEYDPPGNREGQYRDNVLPPDCDPKNPTGPATQQIPPAGAAQALPTLPAQAPPAPSDPPRDNKAKQPARKGTGKGSGGLIDI